MIKLAAIADDLTGANDTALQFAKRNIKSCVKINFANDDFTQDKDVIVIDSDSRDLNANEAYEKVHDICSAIKQYDIRCIYKKIDSTLRGNIGAEIKAVDDVFKPELVIIAPAYPVNKRITIGGYHLLNGMPIELTEIANAPKTPVKESFVLNILANQVHDKKMALLDFLTIKRGVGAIESEIKNLVSNGINWIVCDTVEDKNFMAIMDAVKSFKEILWVGSAGLADYITYFYNWIGKECYEKDTRKGPVLICAGSVSHTTQEQVKTLLEHEDVNLLKLDIGKILIDKIQLEKYKIELQSMLKTDKDILIATAQDDDDVLKAINIGKKLNLSGKQVSEQVAVIMADLVSSIDLNLLSGMILTGGDIAVHICRAIGADSIEVISEIDTAIPLGYVQGKNLDKLFVVTKAGAFGKHDAFIKSVKAIKNIAFN